MPSRHRYKCLNPDCTGAPSRNYTGLFSAMNNEAICPACESRKLQDWGETVEPEGWIPVRATQANNFSTVQASESNLRRIADRYGMTNISNKDGRPAKSWTPPPAVNGPTVSVKGVQVPYGHAVSGSCANLPQMAQPIPVKQTAPSAKGSSALLKKMTNIRAEHKG